jgi:hypothetical protein
MRSQYKVPAVKPKSRTKLLNKLWEQAISQPLQILLNRNIRAGSGQQLPGLSMINSVFAEEILKFFKKFQKLSEIISITSSISDGDIFFSSWKYASYLLKSCFKMMQATMEN